MGPLVSDGPAAGHRIPKMWAPMRTVSCPIAGAVEPQLHTPSRIRPAPASWECVASLPRMAAGWPAPAAGSHTRSGPWPGCASSATAPART